MKYRELLKEAAGKLEAAHIPDAANDAWILMEHCFGMSRTSYYMKAEENAEDSKRLIYEEMINRRIAHVPLQHITGTQNFMGFDFCVNENVLIPRQDTESVVEKAVNYIGNQQVNVLDMCTGSGCIAITVDKMCPGAKVTAADLSVEALEVAGKNNAFNSAEVTFVNSNLFDNIDNTECKYDVIISNPPYIRTEVIESLDEEVRCHEPLMALDGTEDGLEFYRRISYDARGYFKEDGGVIFYEIGCEQAEDVSDILLEAGYENIEVIKDLVGLNRGISASFGKDKK